MEAAPSARSVSAMGDVEVPLFMLLRRRVLDVDASVEAIVGGCRLYDMRQAAFSRWVD